MKETIQRIILWCIKFDVFANVFIDTLDFKILMVFALNLMLVLQGNLVFCLIYYFVYFLFVIPFIY